jgi:aerobic C4-dicarboxylate transport protein
MVLTCIFGKSAWRLSQWPRHLVLIARRLTRLFSAAYAASKHGSYPCMSKKTDSIEIHPPHAESGIIEMPNPGKKKKPWYLNLTTQIVVAMTLGAIVGHLRPELGMELQLLATGFIKLIKMIIAPLIFLTVVTGMAGMGDLKKMGRLGLKAFIYFEVMAVLALGIGMVAVHVLKPGEGIVTHEVSAAEAADIARFSSKATEQKEHSFAEFMYDIIPNSFVSAFSGDNLLQVLFIAILFGIAMAHLGKRVEPIAVALDAFSHIFFHLVGMIMKVAPVGAFGAMAFAIGKFGLSALVPLGKLIVVSVLTMAVFVFVCLGAVAWYYRFSLWKLIVFIKNEIVIVLGTASSETVLPNIMEKMEAAGVSRPVVGLVMPTGYAFNLDGSAIYLAISAMFIAQAYGVELSMMQELTIFAILMLTSKGAAAVTGSGFIVLAATVQATGFLPMDGLALLLGIDRIMSSFRAMTNLIGNAVATAALARMENELDDSVGIITEPKHAEAQAAYIERKAAKTKAAA